jgi:hypothetical protein
MPCSLLDHPPTYALLLPPASRLPQDTWFNRGAASERWIAPERRIKQRAAVPAQVRRRCYPEAARPLSKC